MVAKFGTLMYPKNRWTTLIRYFFMFCKLLLKVKNSIPNIFVIGELGLIPPSVFAKFRFAKYMIRSHYEYGHSTVVYFYKVIKEVNTAAYSTFTFLLDSLGYSYVHSVFPPVFSFEHICQSVRQRLKGYAT